MCCGASTCTLRMHMRTVFHYKNCWHTCIHTQHIRTHLLYHWPNLWSSSWCTLWSTSISTTITVLIHRERESSDILEFDWFSDSMSVCDSRSLRAQKVGVIELWNNNDECIKVMALKEMHVFQISIQTHTKWKWYSVFSAGEAGNVIAVIA